jgi:hypothetical protein
MVVSVPIINAVFSADNDLLKVLLEETNGTFWQNGYTAFSAFGRSNV